MEKLYIDKSRCKGCALCIEACPRGALHFGEHVNQKGYTTVEAEEDKCVACGSCYLVCPDAVFELK